MKISEYWTARYIAQQYQGIWLFKIDPERVVLAFLHDGVVGEVIENKKWYDLFWKKLGEKT
jgi:hypothetical protein